MSFVVSGFMSIADNIAQVQARIAAAAHRSGRNPEEITLMGVSKTFSAESIREAYAAGLRIFGENRVQEFSAKVDALRDLPDTEWHLIGHLQTNKVAKAVELFDAVDSVDSFRMAERLNGFAKSAGKMLPVLIEINVGGEKAKNGVAPDSDELRANSGGCAAMGECENSRPDDSATLFGRSRRLTALFSSTQADSR